MLERGEAPAFIRDWPEVREDLVPYWEAWHHLAGDRSTGFGPGPTPFMALDRYAERFGLDDEFETFQRLMGAMDRTYLEHERERRDRDSSKSTNRD